LTQRTRAWTHKPVSIEADRSKLEEGEVIGGEFVISGGNTPALLDPIEEPLDQVT
jgi:hypothetical protein